MQRILWLSVLLTSLTGGASIFVTQDGGITAAVRITRSQVRTPETRCSGRLLQVAQQAFGRWWQFIPVEEADFLKAQRELGKLLSAQPLFELNPANYLKARELHRWLEHARPMRWTDVRLPSFLRPTLPSVSDPRAPLDVWIREGKIWGLAVTLEEFLAYGDEIILQLPYLEHLQIRNVRSPQDWGAALSHRALTHLRSLDLSSASVLPKGESRETNFAGWYRGQTELADVLLNAFRRGGVNLSHLRSLNPPSCKSGSVARIRHLGQRCPAQLSESPYHLRLGESPT
jgi:hypothetical protein